MALKAWPAACLIAVSLLASCGSRPNIVPNYLIELGGAPQQDDLAKIAQAAERTGFVAEPFREGRIERFASDIPGAPLEAEVVQDWAWPQRRSTMIGVYRVLAPAHGYRILFGDSETSGFKLAGASCAKYLAFVAELKSRIELSRLEFGSEPCDPKTTR